MLGSMEFFRQEFAIPIDKFGEQDRKDHLKKILYPFILRRTKEQVAKDLPEKQKRSFIAKWKMSNEIFMMLIGMISVIKILGTIETQGIQKSQLTILQGLMKLRQICDSPAILNETEKLKIIPSSWMNWPERSQKISVIIKHWCSHSSWACLH